MIKVLVTGSEGQLGRSLQNVFARDPEIEAIYTDKDDLDITNRYAVERFIFDHNFDWIVNCAAYTAVDKAESDSLKAAALNTGAVGVIAEAASKNNVKVIHISTDYVFSGENFRPYEENDEPYPQGIYGRTKLEGEGVLTSFCPQSIIIRTAWLYSEYGHNFVKTMLQKGREGVALRVVSDQIGTPTYAGDLAEAIHSIIRHESWRPGIYHFTNEGVASWYDFAKTIFRLAGMNTEVKAVTTSQYPTPAKRPLYSVLSKEKIKRTFGISIPYWVDSLEKVVRQLSD